MNGRPLLTGGPLGHLAASAGRPNRSSAMSLPSPVVCASVRVDRHGRATRAERGVSGPRPPGAHRTRRSATARSTACAPAPRSRSSSSACCRRRSATGTTATAHSRVGSEARPTPARSPPGPSGCHPCRSPAPAPAFRCRGEWASVRQAILPVGGSRSFASLKKQITIRLDGDTLAYFRALYDFDHLRP